MFSQFSHKKSYKKSYEGFTRSIFPRIIIIKNFKKIGAESSYFNLFNRKPPQINVDDFALPEYKSMKKLLHAKRERESNTV